MRREVGLGSIFVDSGAFGAFSMKRDVNHMIAAEIAAIIVATDRFTVTTNFIIAETHALVLSRVNRVAALATLEIIESGTKLIERVSEEDELQARAILERYDDKSFSYTDATSFAVMVRLGLKDVFTFDRHFAQFGFSPLTS
jgi:predicted nucleic acid-binding protein